jgi:hypothetical protein
MPATRLSFTWRVSATTSLIVCAVPCFGHGASLLLGLLEVGAELMARTVRLARVRAVHWVRGAGRWFHESSVAFGKTPAPRPVSAG